MRHLPADKYNVAWFKLADFVARGEKERALGLYRLLVHSFDDYAFACQLEGDLLLSFNDEAAVNKYLEAATHYEQQGKLLETAAMYEHIVFLASQVQEHRYKLLELCQTLGMQDRFIEHAAALAIQFINNNQLHMLMPLMEQVERTVTDVCRLQLYQRIILAAAESVLAMQEPLESMLHAVLDDFVAQANTTLQQFLATLQEKNQAYYNVACAYIEQQQ